MVRPWYYGVGALPFNFSTLALTSWTVLTEGPPDAIMLRQMGIPAVSQTVGAGYWNPEWLVNFRNIKTVYIVYDNDLAGNNGSIKTGEIFGDKARIYNMWDFADGFDITNYFAAGGTKEEFLDIIRNKSKLHFQLQKRTS
jgi:DNA primase